VNGGPDPSWMRVVQSVYGAFLWLYPKELRDLHGDEMRLAFRDRCREVARGEQNGFKVFVLELLPDTLRSAGEAQLSASFDQMRPRQYWALGLLCCSAFGLLYRDELSRFTLDAAFRAKYAWQDYRQSRELDIQEARVRALAKSFAELDTIEGKALAAYLYRSVYSGRTRLHNGTLNGGPRQLYLGFMVADGDRATALTAGVFSEHPAAYPLIVAVQACEPAVGCNREAAIRRLTELEPDNAYGWSLAFKWASLRHDAASMREAIQRMAESTHYDNYQGRITRDLLRETELLAPGDVGYLADIASEARSVGFGAIDDFKHDVRYGCRRRPALDTSNQLRWLEIHPEMQDDCLRIAKVLSASTDLTSAYWGWRRILEAESIPARRDAILPQVRNSRWLQEQAWRVGVNRHRQDHGWDAWTKDEWLNWAAAWAPGDGEIPSVKRWLVSRGMSVTAPPDFEIPPS